MRHSVARSGPNHLLSYSRPTRARVLEFRTWANVVALGALLVMVLAGGISCALGRGRTTVNDEPPVPDGAPTQQATEVTPPESPRPPQRPEPSPAPRPEPPEPPEAPAARQAVQPRQPLPPLPVIQLDETPRRSELDTRSFSLLPTEPLPITDLLLRLVRDTDLSVVPDPDVEGTFVGELKNVTLREALDLVLRPLDLNYSVRDRFIRVFKRPMETRIFEVNYVPTRRVARRSMIAASTGLGPELARIGGESAAPQVGVGEGVDGSWTQVTASEDGDLFQELAVGVQTLLSEEGKFNLDRKAALLQVTDFPDRLEKVGVYLETVQTRVQRQVQIQGQRHRTRAPRRVQLGYRLACGLARGERQCRLGARSDARGRLDAGPSGGQRRWAAESIVESRNGERPLAPARCCHEQRARGHARWYARRVLRHDISGGRDWARPADNDDAAHGH